MYRRSATLAAALSGILLGALAGPALANDTHFNGTSAIRNGDIVYQDKTKYDVELDYAIGHYEDNTTVDFNPDTWNTSEDLEIRDVNQPSSNWYGVYQPNAWASNDIVLNIAKMDSVSHYAQLQVMAHEFGHSVGLADHSVSSGRCSYLMGSGCPADGWPRTLQTHDLEDLDFIGLR